MKKLLFIFLLIPVVLSAQDLGYDKYVVPRNHSYSGMAQGDDAADGSYATPWLTWAKALESTQSGETVCLRGGVYYPTWTTHADRILTNDSVTIRGYPGEQPIIDGDSLEFYIQPNASNFIYNGAFSATEHSHDSLINLEFRNFNQYFQTDTQGDTIFYLSNAGVVQGYMCVYFYFEDIQIHDCMNKAFVYYSGFSNSWDSIYTVDVFGGTPESAAIVFRDGDETQWVNCDVWNIADIYTYDWETGVYDGGNHADAWKGYNFQGSTLTWTNCRAWNFTDDGWDFNFPGYKVLNNCWAMAGGYNDTLPSFEGNGFKWTGMDTLYMNLDSMGADTSMIKMNNCIGVYNEWGMYNNIGLDNGVATAVSNNARLYNCLFYKNTMGNYTDNINAAYDTVYGFIWKNTLSFGCERTNSCGGVNDLSLQDYDLSVALGTGDHANNVYYTGYAQGSCPEWDYDPSITVTADDFEYGLDSTTIVSMITAARGAGNAMPTNPFTLAETSDLIDAGVDVGLSYSGAAPDIGAFEYTPAAALKKIGRSNGAIGFYNGKIMQKR